MPPDPDLRKQFRALAAHTDGIDTALSAKDAFWASASRFRAHIAVGLHTETGAAHCFKRYPLSPPPTPRRSTRPGSNASRRCATRACGNCNAERHGTALAARHADPTAAAIRRASVALSCRRAEILDRNPPD
ncbi:hypothetical protein KHF85_18235 [Xanthomonas translucens pv. graminis]|uniref:hypothetical protein n=1 Tax=Xanthomonas graminis TaxID=3390026 RepID=UPI0025401F3C|nr:hypothetical protein [Xanthomonas translucens]WIH04681.1 hypothetical protein KHF85_18235 [Xanthomonas translucens pv. graminis]